MAKNTQPPQVPGAPAAPQAGAGADPAAANAAAEDTVTVSKSELQAMISAAVAQQVNSAAPQTQRANPEADLPHQDDVDPATIKSPVLTKQGWVVPHDFGSQAKK